MQRTLYFLFIGLLLAIGGGRALAREYHFVDQACIITIPDAGWTVDTTTGERRDLVLLHASADDSVRSVLLVVQPAPFGGTFNAASDFSTFDNGMEREAEKADGVILHKGIDTVEGVVARSYLLKSGNGVLGYYDVLVLGGFEYTIGMRLDKGDPRTDPELNSIFRSLDLLGAQELMARDSSGHSMVRPMPRRSGTDKILIVCLGVAILLGIGILLMRIKRRTDGPKR